MVTDYQSEFGTFRSGHRREPIRPVQRARDPNPPAMDFRTENHDSYKQFDDIERMKPCKVASLLHPILCIQRSYCSPHQ